MAERIIEGVWDCPYCGTTDIGGLTKHCPECGHPQDKGTKFRMGTKKHYLSDDEIESVGTSPDWACDYCGSLNNAKYIYCSNCGASREKGNKDYFQLRDAEHEKANPANKDNDDLRGKDQNFGVSSKNTTSVCDEKEEESSKISGMKYLLFENKYKIASAIAATLAVILIILGLFTIFSPKQYSGVVSDKSWERSIDIEQYKTLRESDWYLPAGGRLVYTATEIRSYQSVLDHYETRSRQVSYQVQDGYDISYSDNGNGTFTEHQTPRYRTEYKTEYYQEPVYRQEPVYDTKYYYDIDRWVYGRSIKTSGKDDEPYWGHVKLQEQERRGKKHEKYLMCVNVNKKNNTKTYKYKCPEDEWNEYRVDDHVHITVTAGIVTKVELAN